MNIGRTITAGTIRSIPSISTPRRVSARSALCLTLGALISGCGAEGAEFDDEASFQQQAIINGSTATANLGTVALSVDVRGCSGTLIRRDWVLTALHCVVVGSSGTTSGPLLPLWKIKASMKLNVQGSFPADAKTALEIVRHPDNHDIALVRFPKGLGTPIGLSDRVPEPGDLMAAMGYGRNTAEGGWGILRAAGPTAINSFEDLNETGLFFHQNSAQQFIGHGDSGGPTLSFTDALGRNLVGVGGVSTHAFPTTGDFAARSVDAYRNWIKRSMFSRGNTYASSGSNAALADIILIGANGWNTMPVARPTGGGNFTWTNNVLADFPSWASQAGVKKLSGDFNGDGMNDVALIGGAGWNTIPIATSGESGFFTVTNKSATFNSWARTANAKAVVGDYDGDGLDDIAVTGPSGWTNIPVAFSAGNGTFSTSAASVTDFPGWASYANVTPVSGDFDGDGRDDIALVGGIGWGTVPVAYSNGNGTFLVKNRPLATFAAKAALSGVYPVGGDFDGDGRDDIALLGSASFTQIPVAFAELGANTSFSVVDIPVSDANFLSNWAPSTNVQAVAGDFTGDGRDDIVLTGVAGWGSLPMAAFTSSSTFTVTNKSLSSFPGWAATSGVVAMTGRKAQ